MIFLSATCDPWIEHFWLILSILLIGTWCGVVIMSVVHTLSESHGAAAALRAREPAPPSPEARARAAFDESADTDPERPLMGKRAPRGRR